MIILKKILVLLLAVILTVGLVACQPAEPEVVEVPEPEVVAEPEPEPEPEPELVVLCSVVVPGVGIVSENVARDTAVTVTGTEGDYFAAELNGQQVYVQQCFVRLDSEEPFSSYEGELQSDATVFSSAYRDEETGMIPEGSTVTVYDNFSGVKYVSSDEITGYISADHEVLTPDEKDASKQKKSSKKSSSGNSAPTETPVDNSSGGGGGGDTGTGGEDGEYIVVSSSNIPIPDDLGIVLLTSEETELTEEVPEEEFAAETGKILTDNADIYFGFTQEGESYEIVEENDTSVIVKYGDQLQGSVPKWAVIKEEETPYTPWDAYLLYDVKAYPAYRMTGTETELTKNTKVTVIMDLDAMYVVKTEDGTVLYIQKTEEMEELFTTEEPVIEEEEKEESSKKSSNKKKKSSSSSSSQETAPAPAAPTPEAPTQEWTDFVLD